MSLVNDMLNDLEARRANEPKQSVNLDWLTASKTGKGSTATLLRFLPVAIVLLCVLIVAYHYQPWKSLEVIDKAMAGNIVATVAVDKAEDEKAVQVAATQAVPVKNEATVEAVVKEKTETEVTQSVKPVIAQVVTEQKHPSVERIAVETPPVKPVVVKKSLPLTPQQKDKKAVTKAKALIRAKNLQEAEQVLSEQLSVQPRSLQSGELLASLLLSQQRNDEALRLIDQLQQQFGEQANLIMMKARLEIQRGNHPAALSELKKHSPNKFEYPSYYELMAMAAQRSNKFKLAQDTYSDLLKVDAKRGDWWFGLAVSFDAQMQGSNAAIAYQRALKEKGLSSTLQAYAEQRLSVLAGKR